MLSWTLRIRITWTTTWLCSSFLYCSTERPFAWIVRMKAVRSPSYCVWIVSLSRSSMMLSGMKNPCLSKSWMISSRSIRARSALRRASLIRSTSSWPW